MENVSMVNVSHVHKTSSTVRLQRLVKSIPARSEVSAEETSVLMIKAVSLVLVLKQITNMTRDQRAVSETVTVTTAVASIQSASITNVLLVKKTNTSTLQPKNVRLILAQSQMFVA